MTSELSARPGRCTTRHDYRSLANGVSVPRSFYSTSVKQQQASKLYRLKIVEEHETNDMVKVHYIEHNEWRSRSDIVQLNGESESSCDELESHDGETTISLEEYQR